MECSADNFLLLFRGQLVKQYRISRHSDGERRILLGVLHRVDEELSVKHIYIKMMCLTCEITVEDVLKVVSSLLP